MKLTIRLIGKGYDGFNQLETQGRSRRWDGRQRVSRDVTREMFNMVSLASH